MTRTCRCRGRCARRARITSTHHHASIGLPIAISLAFLLGPNLQPYLDLHSISPRSQSRHEPYLSLTLSPTNLSMAGWQRTRPGVPRSSRRQTRPPRAGRAWEPRTRCRPSRAARRLCIMPLREVATATFTARTRRRRWSARDHAGASSRAHHVAAASILLRYVKK